MSATSDRFLSLMDRMGSDIMYHREEGGTACPCRTPEGFRDPAWHRLHATDIPVPPMCNEQGFLAVVTEFMVKGSVQPFRQRGNRGAQREDIFLGEVEKDDRIGIFPCVWNGNVLDFSTWSDAGEDYIVYDGNRYLSVSSEKVPDIDGDPSHHWEVGLRLIKIGRPA